MIVTSLRASDNTYHTALLEQPQSTSHSLLERSLWIEKFDLIIQRKLILTKLKENLLQAEIMYFSFYQKILHLLELWSFIHHFQNLIFREDITGQVGNCCISRWTFDSNDNNSSEDFFCWDPSYHLFETYEYEYCH